MAIPEGYKALAKIGITYKYGYVSGTAYSQLDAVYYEGSTYLALIDSPAGVPRDDGVNWKYLAKGFPSDINDVELAFDVAENRENIVSGEKVKTVFGKIMKWLTDLTAPAFAQVISTLADVKSNTVAGYIPDALALKELYEEQNSNLLTQFYSSITLKADTAVSLVVSAPPKMRVYFICSVNSVIYTGITLFMPSGRMYLTPDIYLDYTWTGSTNTLVLKSNAAVFVNSIWTSG